MKLNIVTTAHPTLLREPLTPHEVANKAYVDATLNTHEVRGDLHLTSVQNTWIETIIASAAEINHLVGVSSLVQPQINARLALSGGTMTGFINLHAAPTAINHAVTKAYSDGNDALKLNLTGGTLTGDLTLTGNPASTLHAATKGYVDTLMSTHEARVDLHLTSVQNTWIDAIAASAVEVNFLQGVTSAVQTQLNARLPLAGGTLTGFVALHAAPTLPAHAATKAYTDSAAALKLNLSGGILTGDLILSAAPTAVLQASTKGYVDSLMSTHEARVDLHLTSAQNTWIDSITASAVEINHLVGVTSAVQTQLNARLPLAGGTMTGVLTLSGAPTLVAHAATKGYVDELDALNLKLTGGTVTGQIKTALNPVAVEDLSRKGYVDNLMSTHQARVDIHLTSAQNTWIDSILASATEINFLQGVTSAVQTQISARLPLTGGILTGNLTMSASNTVFVSKIPTADNELVNKAYVDAKVRGQEWKDPISTSNLINQQLSAPPVSPLEGDVYIIDGVPTGAWAGKVNFATTFLGGQWVFLQERAIIPGDRFGIDFTSPTALGANFVGHSGKIATLLSITGTTRVWDFETPTPGSTTLVFDPQAADFGTTYTYTDEGVWVATNTSVNLTAGDGLTITGNLLNVNVGNGIAIDQDSVVVRLTPNTGLEFLSGNLNLRINTAELQVTGSGLSLANTVSSALNNTVRLSGTSLFTGLLSVGAGADIRLVDPPVLAEDATNKGYVDGIRDTLQGSINSINSTVGGLNTDPVSLTYVNNQLATKANRAGDTFTGFLILHAAPTLANHASTKGYVDSLVSTHEARLDIHITSAQNTWIDSILASAAEINFLQGVTSAVQTQLNARLPLAGGTMTGALVLSGNAVGALEAVTKQSLDAGMNLKVDRAGDTLTGFLVLHANPTLATHASNKSYVDSTVSTHAGTTSLHVTSAQRTLLDALTVTSTEINRLGGVTGGIQAGLDSKVNLSGATMTGLLTLSGAPSLADHASTKAYVDVIDTLKVNRAGDTLTGFLILHAEPTLATHASTRGYVDSSVSTHAANLGLHLTTLQNTWIDSITATAVQINHLVGVTSAVQTQLNARVLLTGSTMTGLLTLSGAPTANLHATTKLYTDTAGALKLNLSGGTLTGALILAGDPTLATHATNKAYTDAQLTSANAYTEGRLTLKVNKAGDTLTGFLTLHANPTTSLHASSKGYVDSTVNTLSLSVSTSFTTSNNLISGLRTDVDGLLASPVTKTYVDTQDAARVALTGSSMTGFLGLHADPSAPMHAATKQYVDNLAQGLSTKAAVRFATTSNLTGVYSNGANGVSSTIINTSNGALVVDGGTALLGDRVLVRMQSSSAQNGDYFVFQTGNASNPYVLMRSLNADQVNEIPGSYFFVYDGLTLKGTSWVFTVNDPITFAIGTDAITVNQFSGPGTVVGGAGLTSTGNTINVNTASSARIVVNADNIDLATTAVSPGNYRSVSVDAYGRVTAGTNPTTLAGFGITDAQALSTNLTSLSGVSSSGILVRTTGNVITTRLLAVSGVGLSFTNNGNDPTNANITVTSNATSVSGFNTIVARDGSGNFQAGTITAALAGNAASATALQTSRNFAVSGDVTATAVAFNGGANVTLAAVLSNTGVVAGTYSRVTVDAKGRLTLGTNPTTLAGFGIVDAATIAYVNAEIATLRNDLHELHTYVMARI